MFIARNSAEVVVFFTSMQAIMILSTIVIVHAGVKSTDVHIMEHTTFVSLRFSHKHVLWTWYLCAANHRFIRRTSVTVSPFMYFAPIK